MLPVPIRRSNQRIPALAERQSIFRRFEQLFTMTTPVEVAWIDALRDSSSLSCCISTTRSDLLRAASLRQATGRRGIAILSALKVEYDQRFEDTTGLDPGKIPLALTNTLIESEGRKIFAVYSTSKDKLTGLLPSTSNVTIKRLNYTSLDARNWIADNAGAITITGIDIKKRLKVTEAGSIQLP